MSCPYQLARVPVTSATDGNQSRLGLLEGSGGAATPGLATLPERTPSSPAGTLCQDLTHS